MWLCRSCPVDGPWVRVGGYLADESDLGLAEQVVATNLGTRYVPLVTAATRDADAAARFFSLKNSAGFDGGPDVMFAEDCDFVAAQWPDEKLVGVLTRLDPVTRRDVLNTLAVGFALDRRRIGSPTDPTFVTFASRNPRLADLMAREGVITRP